MAIQDSCYSWLKNSHSSFVIRHSIVLRHFRGVIVRVLGFDQADGEGEGDADQEGGRQFDAVVVVELDLGQNVRQRDAQEHAGRKPERTADRNVLTCSPTRACRNRTATHPLDRSTRTADSRRGVLEDSSSPPPSRT